MLLSTSDMTNFVTCFAGKRGGRKENEAATLRVHFEVHSLSIQCQTANRHDEATDEDHETAAGNSLFSLSGTYSTDIFALLLPNSVEVGFVLTRAKIKLPIFFFN